MDSCEGSKTLVRHFKSVRFLARFQRQISAIISKCFALCNINISRILEFLQFQTPWTPVLWISTQVSHSYEKFQQLNSLVIITTRSPF